MKVKVKLFATFRQGREKMLDMELQDGTTVLQILDILEIKQEEVAILLINGRDGTLSTELFENDTVSLFPPVGGG